MQNSKPSSLLPDTPPAPSAGAAGVSCLSLGWLSVRGAHPLAHIDAALAGGFDAVGLRLVPPSPQDALVPVVGDEALIRALIARLAATGVSVLDVETVWIGPEHDPASLRPMMDTARRLGCRNLLTMGADPDAARLVDSFSRLCEEADRFGLNVGMEFAAYTAVPTLQAAARLVRATRRANARVLVDALHFARSGGEPWQIAAIDPALLAYCQLADARGARPADDEALKAEARGGRFLPGEGDLPLDALLDALPAGLPIGVETPCIAHEGLGAVERGRRAGEATRRFLARHQARQANPDTRPIHQ
ncbi:MAG: TIM barrel protein [Polaromonas sp.]|nr:TIM barrel protein [Polaromonas sp.]